MNEQCILGTGMFFPAQVVRYFDTEGKRGALDWRELQDATSGGK